MSPTALTASLGLGFLASHLLLSHPPVRKALRGLLGATGFKAVYSVVALGFFLPWVWTWWHAHPTADKLWELEGPIEAVGALLGLIGFGLIGAGAAEPTGSSMMAGRIEGEIPVTPLSRVTRHPVNLGVAHWALAHLIVTPSLVDFSFYGFLFLTGVLGLLHQDWRKRRTSDAYRAYAAATPILPRPARIVDLDGRALIGGGAGAFIAMMLFSAHPVLFQSP